MTAKNDQKIISIIDNKTTAIEIIDNDIMMETVGVDMALDKLRGALDMMETHMNEREFEKASHVGYQEVAHNFVYVQRTLAGLQTAVHQKEALISDIAREANVAYEDVAPYVEKKMQTAVKKSASRTKKDKID
jgi:hypothetical protein